MPPRREVVPESAHQYHYKHEDASDDVGAVKAGHYKESSAVNRRPHREVIVLDEAEPFVTLAADENCAEDDGQRDAGLELRPLALLDPEDPEVRENTAG